MRRAPCKRVTPGLSCKESRTKSVLPRPSESHESVISRASCHPCLTKVSCKSISQWGLTRVSSKSVKLGVRLQQCIRRVFHSNVLSLQEFLRRVSRQECHRSVSPQVHLTCVSYNSEQSCWHSTSSCVASVFWFLC